MRTWIVVSLCLLCVACGAAHRSSAGPVVASASPENAASEVRPGMVVVWGETDAESVVRERRSTNASPSVAEIERVATGDVDGDGRPDAVVSLSNADTPAGVSLALLLRRGDHLEVARSAYETTMDDDARMEVADLRIVDGRVVVRTTLCLPQTECTCLPEARCCEEDESVSRWDGADLEDVEDLARTLREIEDECTYVP